VFISRLMSGTFDVACMARDLVMKRHPGAVIEVVDGKSNSMELGYVVLAAAHAAAEGATVDGVVAAAQEMTRHTRFLFTPLSLEYLRRGGRIGNAAALLGTLLNLKPVLTAKDGATDVVARVRSLGRAQATIISTFAEDIRNHMGLGDVCVQHIHDFEAGARFADRIAEVVGRPVDVLPIGPAVGTHVGPGTVGVAYHTVGRLR
jgi:DegV family protein with EDD domain